jgi:hypothetical protein
MKFTEEQRKIHEWGRMERDLAEIADLSPHGGWLYRFWKWLESIARAERQAIIEERDTARTALRNAKESEE